MKLVVLGATGGTGLEIVRAALEKGHSVTAFARSAEKLRTFGDRIGVSLGDLLNSAELAEAIRGHDAVLSGFGPRLPIAKAEKDLLHRFALSLTHAMHLAGVRRVVVESNAFLFKDSLIPHLFGRLFFPSIVVDVTAMERVLRESGLDWTIVRPVELTNKPFTGKYRIREDHLPGWRLTISRADVADCLVKTAADPALIGKLLGISN